MTIKTYIDKLEQSGQQPTKPGQPSLAETMLTITEVWNNNACKGYFIAAAQDAGLDQDTIRKVLESLSPLFDEMSVDEAEREYINY